jgi:hypothetical protein
VIIQLSIHVPDIDPHRSDPVFNTERFYKRLEEWIADEGDLTIDEWEIIQEDSD